ncbi:LysR substrate-binding domain-containing protein [Bosea lathyri]|jgi:aminoethylphosphonate catabolism LysR family transcriptional regulator|uniref:Aminoethylphosphonate catabolism associated LysR family transcriptional regulator n=1 Tax=Bosea lathyri TaxID=1036778 RepID=A0A1H6BYV9_9HYPH|nr:LysR substrate-binding domain-containing protein [Bosea lathyri]SEG65823.1 aminoethylphosphonate catabolism associated LysR family transcriptional regulator [Bosea lathyri]
MRYSQLRSFHAVASAGGFNAAAAQFHISQPTLTAQVGLLEEEYGVELFVRKGRRRELSDAGRQLLAITTRLFAEEGEAQAFLEQSRELRTGKLSISAVGPFHVTEMLAAFNRAHPGIELAVKLGNSTAVLDDLFDYKSDVAILAYIDEDDRLLTIPYRRHPVAVFLRKDHRLARRKSIAIAELEGEPMIIREHGSTTRRAFEEALLAAKTKPRTVMEIGSREAIREAVIRGLGISYVSVAEFVPDPDLRLIPISNAEIYTYAHVVVLKKRETSRIVGAFLDVVRQTRKT